MKHGFSQIIIISIISGTLILVGGVYFVSQYYIKPKFFSLSEPQIIIKPIDKSSQFNAKEKIQSATATKEAA